MFDPDSELGARYQSIIANPDWYQTNIPCQVGCPAHTDVSTYIGLISQARFDEAYLLNRNANVVPGVLGRTCARPCEPVCRRNKVDGKPIAICWLKRAAADHREYQHRAERPPVTKDKTVGVVGAGSAGLAAACYVPNALTGPDNKIIPGADLRGVEDGIKLLAKTNYGDPAYIGKRVVVYGGGFTAMDCCRTSIRFGAEKVYVIYRRSKEEMPSDEYEVDEAMVEHVEFMYLLSIVEVLSKDGVHVSGIKLIRNKLGDPDASGRRRAVAVPGSEFILDDIDTVIPALGQSSDGAWVPAKELNLDVTRWGIPLIDRETWMTSYPGLFAGGDYTQGSRNLISAIGDGRDAATTINRYLGGVDKPAEAAEEIELPDFRRGMVDDYESIADRK